MDDQDPRNGPSDLALTGSGNKRGKRGSAGIGPGDPVRGDSGPRLDALPAQKDAGSSAEARRAVVTAIEGVLPLEDLPSLLWWVGSARSKALWRLEALGWAVADAMGEAGGEFEEALAMWTDALALAREKIVASSEPLGPRPVWAYWTLFTRAGEPESLLTALLREEVGYPTDAEAGIPVPIEQVLTPTPGVDSEPRRGA